MKTRPRSSLSDSSGSEQQPMNTEPSIPDESTTPPQPSPATTPSADAPPMGDLFLLNPGDATDDAIQDIVNRHVKWIMAKHPVATEDNVLFLHEPGSISRVDSNRIYSSVSRVDPDKSILLIINSTGGDVAAAYFIAKLCRQYTTKSFKVAVARQAKSAATLICCGADQIHMGSLSELGPIDPQFGQVPALALKHSIEHLAQLASQYPTAKELFSDYLSKSLNIEALGYYERVAESAKQYAERLLRKRRDVSQNQQEIEAIAQRLVYTYKDHGFVIDSGEAVDIFGGDVVRFDSAEYKLANELYPALDLMEWVINKDFGRTMKFVGSDNDCWAYRRKRTSD
jgi:hypothetical protein